MKIKNIPDWSFQDEAVKRIVNYFRNNPKDKTLLVIPTGGGKTIAAIRSINDLSEKGFLNREQKALWIVHTKALKDQAKKEINKEENKKKFKFHKDLSNILEVYMKTVADEILRSPLSQNYKLIIIDEAHHSAAATYQNFFRKNMGVLGLTATPTRNDELELDFKDIVYSITYRELQRKNVILIPEFDNIHTNISVDAKSIKLQENEKELEKFDTKERNIKITKEIFKRRNKLKKILVFTGTINHAKKLYEELDKENKILNCPYQHIGYIYGGDNNEKKIRNDDYLEEHKKYKKSILVNCKLLNEGYDDSSINAVVMATPTNSILYYLQCVGRVVRNPYPNKYEKAYVLEVVDKLPNINYRIDNRWLYADISDYLEPEIIDIYCVDNYDFNLKITEIFKKHKINKEYYKLQPRKENFENISIIMFNDAPSDQPDDWNLIFISPINRMKYVNIFNKISNNIDVYYKQHHETIIFKNMKIDKKDPYFSKRKFLQGFFDALEKAYNRKFKNEKVDCLKYIIFHKKNLNFLEFIIYYIKLLITKFINLFFNNQKKYENI